MPLYSCQRCGWATASSWPEAVQGHEDGCLGCSGSVELVPVCGRPHENIGALGRVGRPFEMHESSDLHGGLRLTLLGGLDIVVADRLTARIRVLRSRGRPIRVDVSGLEFIDCTGLQVLIDELTDARRAGQSLEVDRPVSATVKRVITFMDAASVLWPSEEDSRPPLRVINGGVGEAAGSGGTPRPRPGRARALGPVEDEAEMRPRPPGAATSDP